MGFLAKVFDSLFLIGIDPESMRKWRITVSVFLAALLLFMIWALGSMSHLGQPGFAYASDIDRKIDSRLTPLVAEQAAQRALLTVVSNQLKDTLSEAKAAEIRGFAVKRCHEKLEPEKEVLNREIDRAQAEFFKQVERYYKIPSCDDL